MIFLNEINNSNEIVVKLPNDNFKFEPHTDNSVGGNSNEGKNTVNICVILDDFTDENGTLEVFNKDDGKKKNTSGFSTPYLLSCTKIRY